MSDRGAHRAARVLPAGALEVFTGESSITYRRATGALAVFAADPRPTVYKRAAGDLEVAAVDPLSLTHKLQSEPVSPIYK